jgi:4-aminobutyrate aminotransferase-like enzyme
MGTHEIPGRISCQLVRRLRQVESRNVTYSSVDFPVFWETAKGVWVMDSDRNRYLDLTSAFGVTALGHNPFVVQRALHQQSKKMWHGMGDVHPNPVKVELLEALATIAPGALNVSILSSSGADAVESACKTARLFTGKPGVIAFKGAYHGLSYGTLALTDRPEFSSPFRNQLLSHVTRVPFPDSLRGQFEEDCLAQVEKALTKSVGAILVEPIQGRGGIRVPKPSFLKKLRQLATRHSVLLIADEIFTGFGRTGKMFAVEHSGVVPDLLCVGKALANGFPISACIGSKKVMAAWPASDGEAIHTSTFLGNPLGCAMAVASVREIQKQRLPARAKALGDWWINDLRDALMRNPHVADIRGRGLMIGIELVKDKRSLVPDPKRTAQIVERALKCGLLLLSGGNMRNVLSLTPPLVISKRELSHATALLKELLDE